MRFSNPVSKGFLLIVMVVIAMVWANSPYKETYFHFFEKKFTIGFENFALTESLHVWINDGLMAVFFFTIGLEIKREILAGELSTIRKASLPIAGAIGGMIIPALLYYIINYNTEAASAWGIPMATDIAFTLGVVALAGKAISNNGKVLLTALATVDDIGAILVIAFFLTPEIDMDSLIAGTIYFGVMILANYLRIRNMWFYLIVGVLGLWIAILLSGIHATLAGVLIAFTIPARRKITEKEYKNELRDWAADFENVSGDDEDLLTEKQEEILHKIVLETKRAGTPLQRVEFSLAPVVNFIILPLFALANSGVEITEDFYTMLLHPVSIGIICGLVLGKLIGISILSRLMVFTNLGKLSEGVSWSSIYGMAMMAGIGFTMSLFIAELALKDEYLLNTAKIGILVASLVSALLGLIWFKLIKKKSKNQRAS
ncbi:Na(+)/H(+) antiporter NhaA [Kordia sp. SMS9]|nr:Na(+)/H(+) antiporter NhaA [Kordia sp. SMS9]